MKLGRVAIDGTEVKASASRHKAMSYARMPEREAALEAEAKEKSGDPDAVPAPKAQRNFIDSGSRIMLSKPDGFIYGDDVGAIVDEAHQVIVATGLTADATDTASLPDLVDQVGVNTGHRPRRFLADAGDQSDDDLEHLASKGIDAYVAVRRDRHSTPPAAPRRRIPRDLSPRVRMARQLRTKQGRAHHPRAFGPVFRPA